jgi:hypothetical protein
VGGYPGLKDLLQWVPSAASRSPFGQTPLWPPTSPCTEPFLLRDAPERGITALRAAHGIPQVGHSRRGDGVGHLQANLPEGDAAE